MEQVDPKSQAVHVAARRAKAAGIVKIQDINGKLVGTPFEQVSERSSLIWATKKSNLPEKMIEAGEMTLEDFPAWTRPGIKSD